MQVLLIRHGQTPGNAKKQYIGRTDEPLSEAGAAALREKAPDAGVSRVYCSPMLRARQTAAILFPNAEQVVCPDLREMDFGAFERRTALDMAEDPAYRAWVDGGASAVCPGGEGLSGFTARTAEAFSKAVSDALSRGERRLVIVAHGGSIMAILYRFARPAQPVFSRLAGNGEGYLAELDEAAWERDPALTGVRPYSGGAQ